MILLMPCGKTPAQAGLPYENYQQTPGNGDIPPAPAVPSVSLLYREISVVRQRLSLVRPGRTGYQWRTGRVR